MKEAKYKFSVVIPIYNTEQYLEETVESVINQTLGFKKNIQIIFVNDGSKDNSKEICLRYKEKYPDNIIYVEQENSGVSSARNNGMNYIEGEYVNFLDSDDKWDKEAFKKIYKFLRNNSEIKIASGRMKFFEAREDYHFLDYKFDKTKIVNILEDYEDIQLHVSSTFIKSEIAKKVKFDTKLKYGEDAIFITELILNEGKYAVIREAKYNYRRRFSESSAIQNQEKNISYYTNTIEYFHKKILKRSKEKYNCVIKYVQFILMYDLQFRIKKRLPDILDEDEKSNYIKQIVYLLKRIDDDIITKSKNITSEYKIFALSLKYERDIKKELEYKNGKLYFNNQNVNRLKNNKTIFRIDILEIEKGKLILEGRVRYILPKEYFNIYLKINDIEKIKIDLIEGKKSIYTKNTFALDRKILYYYTYKIIIDLEKVKKINFMFAYENTEFKLKFRLGDYAKLSTYAGSYYVKEKYILSYEKNNIKIKNNRKKNRIKSEIRNIKKMIKEKEIKSVFIRLLYFFCKKFKSKEIWLISDRTNVANDNGEEFFRYVVSQNNENIRSYFVISKKSIDYKRMKKVGEVIDINSLKYKIYFLLASKIISSQADKDIMDVFEEKNKYFNNLRNFEFIFLQHGVIVDKDGSKWLNKFNKNIGKFVTSGISEYNSIVNGDYYYTENEVILTGLPRFDKLENNRNAKSILILPTQRRKLVEWNPELKAKSPYNPFFKDSECFKFYNNLINDERILNILAKKGYKIRFALHPLHQKQAKDFVGNKFVEIIDGSINYSKEFGENLVLITDYSSVAFDFAYLKKEVVYAQFDRKEFFENQLYDKGYYDLETNGFGPVCYDYETTIKEIISIIKNDCRVEKKYLDRINKFYYKFDKDNSKRVYEAIIGLDR